MLKLYKLMQKKTRKNIILSVNPDEACILSESDIIKKIAHEELIAALNVNNLLNHIHPDARYLDKVYEFIDQKHRRFIRPYANFECPKLRYAEIRSINVPKIPLSIEAIRKYKIDGVNVGLAALSTAASFSKCTSDAAQDYGHYLEDAWLLAHKSLRLGLLLKAFSFDRAYIFNGRHAISRPIAEVLKLSGTEVCYYELDNSRTRYSVDSRGFHDIKEISRRIKLYQNGTVVSAERYFYSLQRGQINSEYLKIHKIFDKDIKLSLNSHIRRVIFFTSSPDEFFSIKDESCISDRFKNQNSLAMYLAEKQDLYGFKLIVRLHPYLSYKHSSWAKEWDFKGLTDRGVSIIYPSDTLLSYRLLEEAWCCVTVGSSIGPEAIRNAVPCIDVGETVANALGITVDGNDELVLNKFLQNPWMNIDAKKLNIKYGAYLENPPYIEIVDSKGKRMLEEDIIRKVSPSRRFARYTKRLIIKNTLFNKLYTYIFYIFIRRKCAKIISEIDRFMPLNGELREGYLFFPSESHEIRFESFRDLIPNKSIELKKTHAIEINKIFDFIEPIFKSYLGKDCIIDSVCVTKITNVEYESVSANWHTDNVGHNLKVYFCIEGDGSIVTKYRPKTNLIDYVPSIIEDLRMIGVKRRTRLNDEVDLAHRSGSLAIFDTNGEHRGGYTKSQSSRVVLEIEIANRSKAQKLKDIAPIGIRSGQNTSYLHDEFLNCFKYGYLLDKSRLRRTGKNLYIYGAAPTHYVID